MLSARALRAGRGVAVSVAFAAILVAVSFALRHAVPVQAEAGAVHDDALFVRLALHVAGGRWLGPYDQLTLVKGAGYPIFIAFAWLAHVPLKLAEHAVYVSGCLALALAVARLFGSRAGGLACFAVLALNPVFWSEESLARVVREGLYIGLTTWILALATFAFLLEREGDVAGEVRRKWGRLAALGAFGGAFWLTREEGLWLAPALVILAGSWAWSLASRPRGPGFARATAAFVGIPIAAFAVVVGAMDLANWKAYGALVNSELRSEEFRAAYGALARIEPRRWQRFVPVPSDALRSAYEVSPAARELAPSLEGPTGKAWRDVGCADATVRPESCTEILAGWLAWALRDAAAAAGHFRSAATSAAFFERLAREVNEACDRGALRCGPRRDTLAPAWRPEFLGPLIASTLSVGRRLATLGDMHVRPKQSAGPPDQLEVFRRTTRAWLSGVDAGHYGGWRLAAAEAIARLQVAITSVALPTAVVAWAGLVAWAVVRHRSHSGHVLVAALIAAAATRVALLGFLDATSFPADNLLYLTPATPLALAIAPCVALLGWAMRRPPAAGWRR